MHSACTHLARHASFAPQNHRTVWRRDLSKARAKAVKDYLIKKGVAADHLSSEGFGETKPIDTNDTAEGRAKNRRVIVETTMYEVK